MKWLLWGWALVAVAVLAIVLGHPNGVGAAPLAECPPDCTATPVVVEPGPTWTSRLDELSGQIRAVATQLAVPSSTPVPTATSTPAPTATASPTPDSTAIAATASATAVAGEREALRDMASYTLSRQLQQGLILLVVVVFLGCVGVLALWLK